MYIFSVTVLYSKQINTNFLPCIVYLLVSFPTYSGLAFYAIFRENSIMYAAFVSTSLLVFFRLCIMSVLFLKLTPA